MKSSSGWIILGMLAWTVAIVCISYIYQGYALPGDILYKYTISVDNSEAVKAGVLTHRKTGAEVPIDDNYMCQTYKSVTDEDYFVQKVCYEGGAMQWWQK